MTFGGWTNLTEIMVIGRYDSYYHTFVATVGLDQIIIYIYIYM
jgi:hypothetical protein